MTCLQAAVLPHAPLIPTTDELSRLSRVRSLMATSTREHPNSVRILFYGQSITLYPWWQEVADGLQAAYPEVRFDFDNRAISGFQDWALDRTVAVDLIPTEPDLVILHAFGDGHFLPDLIGQIRAGTTTEVLLQQDYVLGAESIDENTNPATIKYSDIPAYRNYVSLPRAAELTGACLARIHDPWKDYCRTNHIDPASLLNPDGFHPIADSNHLLAEFTLAYLLPYPDSPTEDPWNEAKVRTLDFDQVAAWRDGQLVCDFTGRTVELTLKSAMTASMEVLVDGLKPSKHPELYGFTRVSPTHFSNWPTLSHVGSEAPLLEEYWTFVPFNITEDGQGFNFRVTGSVTGEDGVGTNTVRFVSKSRRVVIEPGDHWLDRSVQFGKAPIPKGFFATWLVRIHGQDSIDSGTAPSTRPRGDTLTLVQGLSDGPHRLVLSTEPGAEASFLLLRVRSPAGRAAIQVASAPAPPEPGRLLVQRVSGRTLLSWSLDPGWKLMTASLLGPKAKWREYPQVLIRTERDHRLVSVSDSESLELFQLVPSRTAP